MTIKNRGKIKFHSDRSIINNTVVSVTRRHTSHYPTSRDVSLRSPITIHPLYYRHRTYIIKDTSPSARGARTSTERERQVGRIECVLRVFHRWRDTGSRDDPWKTRARCWHVDALLHSCNTVDGDNNRRSNAACTVEDVFRRAHTTRLLVRTGGGEGWRETGECEATHGGQRREVNARGREREMRSRWERRGL